MKHRRSILGAHIRKQRKVKGLSRSDLAMMLNCLPQVILRMEKLGDDESGLLDQLTELLDLDPKLIDLHLNADKKYRQAWLRFCGQAATPMIMPVGKPMSSPVEVPFHIVQAGHETIEAFAREFAKDWNHTIELFIQNHIRIVISPSGDMEIHEMGIFEP